MMLNKDQMSEEDVKRLFITPALEKAGWPRDRITMETRITDGRIRLQGNLTIREKPKKADYILYVAPDQPIAIVEAKTGKHTVSQGLQQAMAYARMMDIPFAYSSNGNAFHEHDFLTGREREIPLEEFPSPDELVARYQRNAHDGQGLNEAEKRIRGQHYYTSQKTYAPRYYQRNAVNRAVEAVARGERRILIVMATGTGKTYTAFQIVYRLLKSGLKRKVLYLVDRNNLADQSIQQDFAPLEKTIHKVNFAKDDETSITSYEVYFSLYQQLADRDDDAADSGEEEAVSRLAKLFKPDFFDLVIVDECHRGSAKKDSSWREILEYFSSATQIGMTATPKETKYISNISYFGEPVYSYSLRQGIDDGFLAPFKVIGVTTDIGEGWRPRRGQVDVNGVEIPDRIYTNSDYDYNIIIEDRIMQVAGEITEYLKSTGRMQKTIVFCANEDHAERMRSALVNLNADMCRENPDYVVRITGSDEYGKKKLDYFISVSAKYPVIATTSQLLSTGADCKMTKLIVLDKMIGSMTEFKQIIGRGTRLREKEGKLSFVVMDFRRVSRLFADPDWDGPVEVVD
ncbi:MAG: DEAD/DEAH box helicase family protein, partial [Mailhella sp.]|nr:DEAD/DEAH box helicase family protein [Mailhella sp.]